jgi:hypothetical protein
MFAGIRGENVVHTNTRAAVKQKSYLGELKIYAAKIKLQIVTLQHKWSNKQKTRRSVYKKQIYIG